MDDEMFLVQTGPSEDEKSFRSARVGPDRGPALFVRTGPFEGSNFYEVEGGRRNIFILW